MPDRGTASKINGSTAKNEMNRVADVIVVPIGIFYCSFHPIEPPQGAGKVKNSHIVGAVAAAPGKEVVMPRPSSIRRNAL